MKSSTMQIFDANFEGLLREAAADPRSMLLRVERPQVLAALRSHEAPASVAMAGLSSVERELLASYRAELGFLLRQAIVSILLNEANAEGWIDQTISDECTHDPRPDAEWSVRAGEGCASNAGSRLAETDAAISLVLELLTGRAAAARIPQIAAASLRIEPVDQARVYAGTYLASVGDSARSIDVLREVLDGNSTALNEMFAREGTALALGRAGKYYEASAVLQPALTLNIPRAEVPLRYLFYSAMTSDRSATIKAGGHVASSIPPTHASIPSFCADLAAKVRRGKWHVNSRTASSVKSCMKLVDTVSLRILHAITD